MNKKNIIIKLVSIILIGELMYACNTENSNLQSTNLKILSYTKDLAITSNDPDILVGNFSGLAVDAEGDIYAADKRLQKIHIFSPDGNYLDSIGRRGEGPGEFTNLDPNIHILSDTLYVNDDNALRVSIFDLKSRQLAGTFNIPDFNVNGVRLGSAKDVFPLPDGNILMSFVNPYIYPPKEQEPSHMTTVSLLSKSGEIISKSVLQFPTPFPTDQKLVHFGSGMNVFSNVFFYPDIRMGADSDGYLYIGKSDSLVIRKYDKYGELTGVFHGAISSAPLESQYLDSLYDSRGNTFEKAVDEAGVPDRWPAFQDFLIDDLGRCWIELIDPHNSHKTWWIFNTDGKPEWKIELLAEIKLYEVQKGKAYGIFYSDNGISFIMRFSLKEHRIS